MSKIQKAEVVKLVSPAGKIQWFNLTKPDKFGNYNCELHLAPTKEAMAFVKAIKSVGKGQAPIKDLPDGTIVIKMKQKVGGVRKSDNTPYTLTPPVICGADGKPLSEDARRELSVGNGSEAKFQVAVSTATVMGQSYVTVKPAAVQLIKVIAYQASPFDAIEAAIENDEDDSSDSATAFSPVGTDADDF